MQAVAVQVLGGLFFYIASVYLTKADLGIISWLNAISIFITTFLGMGLEQVVVRRIAVSKRSDWAAAAFFLHTVAGFVIVLIFFTAMAALLPGSSTLKIMPWFFVAQGLLYMGTALKQFLNAHERFTPYALIALISNTSKILIALLLIQRHALSVHTVLMLLIGTACFELCCLVLYVFAFTPLRLKFRFKAYVLLIRESFAQYLSVISDISLSRIDWVMLGFFTPDVILADYSFAYRAFELAKLPVAVFAPIILPRLSRIMALNKFDTADQRTIDSFNRVGVFFTTAVSLALNVLWVPVVTLLTKGKYGDTNAVIFLILSACIPLQFFINLLWSISFGAKKYRNISAITISCAIGNIVLNLVMIPLYNGLGAAAAFLITTLLQAILYCFIVSRLTFTAPAWPLVVCVPAALAIYLTIGMTGIHSVFRLIISLAIYTFWGLATGHVGKKHIQNVKKFLTR